VLNWPVLEPRYAEALRAAVEFILQRTDPVGIIAAGSIVRGEGDAGSDLDIYVVHTPLWRQRIQKRFHGVPAEIFVNPPISIRRYFADERDRPCTAHMLAHGFVVLDRAPVVEELRAEAQTWLGRTPGLDAEELTLRRYLAADAYENALDVAEADAGNASLILHAAVYDMLCYTFLAADRPLPRAKAFLVGLDALDPPLGKVARQYYAAPDTQTRLLAAAQIARHTIQATGFFEWESQRGDVQP
jgi:predicted nucleotidyltransferase